MGLLLLLLFLAVSVKQDEVPLRSGCSASAPQVASLSAGTPVTLRYSVSGESVPCYKVAVELDGKRLDGYLPASALDGLDAFSQSRRNAAWVDVRPAAAGSPQAKPAANATSRTSNPAVAHAWSLMEDKHFEEALTLLDAEIKRHPDAELLYWAGQAAWKADDNRRALDYFRKSAELKPAPEVLSHIKELQKESESDNSVTKLYGVRVALRFDRDAIAVDTARQVVHTIDETLARVSQQVGCPNEDKIVTIAQSWESYRKSAYITEWSGGLYDGRIRVPINVNGLDTDSLRRLSHEATHACLSRYGALPAWLNEGLAQKLSGEAMPERLTSTVGELAREGKLPPLANLSGGFGALDSRQAAVAYTQALMAADLLVKDFGFDGLRNLLRSPERIPTIALELDKRLVAQAKESKRGTLVP